MSSYDFTYFGFSLGLSRCKQFPENKFPQTFCFVWTGAGWNFCSTLNSGVESPHQ